MEPFPRSEYLVRHQRAFELMERDGFNALVVTTESNFTYFTGIQTPSFASRSRPIALILAPASEPLIIVAKSHVPHARRSGVAEVLGFDGFEPEGLAVMRDALRSMVPSGGRVGCEFGHEMHVGLTHVGLHDLMTQLSGLQFEDASGLIWDLRLTKSEAETQMLREIGRITGLAYDALIAIARPECEPPRLIRGVRFDAHSPWRGSGRLLCHSRGEGR